MAPGFSLPNQLPFSSARNQTGSTMALPPTIYRASIELADTDRGCYETLTATLARHPSETAERLVTRLLAYALCYEEELVFTKGISAGDEPDLWRKGPDGRILLWIEVGLPEAERLLKSARHAERVVLFAYGGSRWRWEAQHLAKLGRAENITVLSVAQEFIDQLVEQLQRGIHWSLTVTDGSLYLNVAGTTLESTLERLA